MLICSWMNVAVDNVLEKLLSSKQIDHNKIVRFGAGTYKISENVQTILLSKKGIATDFDYRVFGSTLASAHLSLRLNNNKLFDVVIVDEAGASTVTQTLLALRFGKKFILVGDHYQLPPIMQVFSDNYAVSNDAIANMKISLFEHLVTRWPKFLTVLDTQYRMDEKIAELSNRLVYDEIGKLKTGTDLTNNPLPSFNELKLGFLDPSIKNNIELKKILSKEYPLVFWMLKEIIIGIHGITTQKTLPLAAQLTPWRKLLPL